MSTADDSGWEFEKHSNICAVCMSIAQPPDETGIANFFRCHSCGTMLVFDSSRRLQYSAPESLEPLLNQNRIFSTIPESVLDLVPESVARENFTVPIGAQEEKLIVGMVHPLLDVREKLRFISNRDVLAVKISSSDFEKLVRSYGEIG